MKPHKHAELIKAWADGAVIQCYDSNPREHRWVDCIPQPSWHENVEYRIKPQPKPDVVRYGWAQYSEKVGIEVAPDDAWHEEHESHRNLKLTFDGETKKLKSAEVLK